MIATSTTEPVRNRSGQAGRLDELITAGQDTGLRDYIVVWLGAVGSENPHCVVVPDVRFWISTDANALIPWVVASGVSYEPQGLVREPFHANPNWSHSSALGLSHIKSVRQPDFEASSSEASRPLRPFGASLITELVGQLGVTRHPIVQEFALGFGDVQSAANVIAMADRIVQAALDHTVEPEFSVDEEDGDIEFDLRLENGLLVMANLFPDGTLDASVYDDSQGMPVKTVRRMPRATTSAEELIHLFRAGIDAGAA